MGDVFVVVVGKHLLHPLLPSRPETIINVPSRREWVGMEIEREGRRFETNWNDLIIDYSNRNKSNICFRNSKSGESFTRTTTGIVLCQSGREIDGLQLSSGQRMRTKFNSQVDAKGHLLYHKYDILAFN